MDLLKRCLKAVIITTYRNLYQILLFLIKAYILRTLSLKNILKVKFLLILKGSLSCIKEENYDEKKPKATNEEEDEEMKK